MTNRLLPLFDPTSSTYPYVLPQPHHNLRGWTLNRLIRHPRFTEGRSPRLLLPVLGDPSAFLLHALVGHEFSIHISDAGLPLDIHTQGLNLEEVHWLDDTGAEEDVQIWDASISEILSEYPPDILMLLGDRGQVRAQLAQVYAKLPEGMWVYLVVFNQPKPPAWNSTTPKGWPRFTKGLYDMLAPSGMLPRHPEGWMPALHYFFGLLPQVPELPLLVPQELRVAGRTLEEATGFGSCCQVVRKPSLLKREELAMEALLAAATARIDIATKEDHLAILREFLRNADLHKQFASREQMLKSISIGQMCDLAYIVSLGMPPPEPLRRYPFAELAHAGEEVRPQWLR